MTPGRDRGTRRGVAWRTDRGSVTAELALSIPVLVLLLLAGLTAVGAVVTKLQCVDAAREAARAAARGASGEQAGRSAAPDGAAISVRADGDDVHATVTARVPLLVRELPVVTVTCTAVAAREPGGAP
jgi:Flp pilus assembly protein TadG